MIACRALGPLEVSVDGAPPPPQLRWSKHIGLLLYLAYSPGRTRGRDHLAGLLWGERTEDHAKRSLNVAMSDIRRFGGGPCFETTGSQVRLVEGTPELDTVHFDALCAAGDWAGAAALVRGPFLDGFGIYDSSPFEDWLRAERLVRDRRSVEALVRCGEGLLQRGAVEEALAVGEQAGKFDAGDAASRFRMRALTLAGDRAAALRVYEEFARRLAAELGAQPDAETTALAERVRSARRPEPDTPPPAPRSRRAPLCGRGTELGRVVAAWDDCRRRRAATLAVVMGDPGTGKSRFAEEIAARGRLDGAATVIIRTVPGDLSEPESLLTRLAGWLLDVAGVVAAPPGALGGLAARFPAWAERFPVAARAGAGQPAAPALRAVMCAACEEQPIVVLIDDAHWLDRASLDLLEASLRDLAGLPLLVVLTASSHPANEALDRLRAHVGRELQGLTVTLGPLSQEDTRELARWAVPEYDAEQLDRLTRRIHADSAGLPLLTVELALAVWQGYRMERTQGAWPRAGQTLYDTLPGELPDNVVAAVRVNFNCLERPLQTVLRVAAVLGGERVGERKLGAASRLQGAALTAALDELEYGRWLVADASGYSFLARLHGEIIARDLVSRGERERILRDVMDLD